MLKKAHPLTEKNPHTPAVEAILRDIFCRGVEDTQPEDLAKGGIYIAALAPITLLLCLPLNAYRILIVIGFWYLSYDFLSDYTGLSEAILAVGILGVLFKDVEDAISTILKGLLVSLSFGYVLKWVCRGYMKDNFICRMLIESPNNNHFITSMVAVLDKKYVRLNDQLIALVTGSTTPDGEKSLVLFLEEYERNYAAH